jgi:hypothetical protein
MTLQGKGFYIWKVPSCENGVAANIAAQAAAANLTHVLIKIADGTANYNISNGTDLVPAVVSALHARGIQAWGWQYTYGSSPGTEGRVGGARASALGLDGFVVDAESQYEKSGMSTAAQTYMTELRKYIPSMPVALSTFRYPSYHNTFPYTTFMKYCDITMPQVYWEEAHNPVDQLSKSYSEWIKIAPNKPFIPTGPTYSVGSWSPSTADIKQFMNSAKSKNLPAINFFSWDECRGGLGSLWNYIRDYVWTVTASFQEQYIAALNSHNADTVAALYSSVAVQITPTRTVMGTEAIRTWYSTLFNQLLPSARFTLASSTTSGNTRHINWTAASSRGNVTNGSDSFGLISDKIVYHYSFYSIT